MSFADFIFWISIMILAFLALVYGGAFICGLYNNIVTQFKNKIKDAHFKRRFKAGCYLASGVIVLSLVIIPPMKSCLKLNAELDEFLDMSISENTFDKIIDFEKRIADEGIWSKLYIKRIDELELQRQKTYQFIDITADELSEDILQLEVCEYLKSEDQIKEIRYAINELYKKLNVNGEIDENTAYYEELQRRTENYDYLLEYNRNFEALVSSCKKACGYCSGSGQQYKRCSYCDGKGKILVTWYSEGDWGYTSYTSYECTYCGGDGKTSKDCSNCNYGYVYDFSLKNK